MIKVLLLLGLFLSTALPADQSGLAREIKSLPATLKNTGSAPKESTCNGCFEIGHSTSTLYSAHNRKNVELSILTPERAKEIFKALQSDEDNSFNYNLDGCYARAHRMAMVMDEMGVISGKAFLEGDLYMDFKNVDPTINPGWHYHVASVVFVRKNGKLTPTVLDPSLFDRPVSFNEWKALILKKPKSKLRSEYFTNRFAYDPDNRHDDLSDYLEDHVDNMKSEIKKNTHIGYMLELADKKKKDK